MIGALWILAFTVIVGVVLYICDLRVRKKLPADTNETASGQLEPSVVNHDESPSCCGLHLVCEKESLSPMSPEILYYDDEELDRFIGRDPESYTADEEEEFREILMTLRPEDITGWARSITQRQLSLPTSVRDELLLLVSDLRSH